jgi:DUF1365 family protein
MNWAPLSLVQADVFHGRRGRVINRFSYRTDFVLIAIDDKRPPAPRLLSTNRFNLWSLRDRDYGDGQQSLNARARRLREQVGLPELDLRVFLLTQPACLGYAFNPVSFWLFIDGCGRLRAVVSEVNNTSGDRHSYLAARRGLEPIAAGDRIEVRKIFHVSPFQPVDGDYAFSFDLNEDQIAIRIDYRSDSDDGLVTSLKGPVRPMTDARLIASFARLPFGAARVIALIHWQALKLWIKGARFRTRPQPPAEDLTS